MMSFWERADENVGGCSFYISNLNHERSKTTFFKRLFFMTSRSYGKILPSGFNYNPYDPAMRLTYTDWLSGGVTVWRFNIFREYSFDEWFSGYGANEDVDFSYRVGKKYKLAVNPDARVQHLMDTQKKGNEYRIGKKEVLNRLYFVKKHRELSAARSLWTSIGELLSYAKAGNWHKARGALNGILLYVWYGNSVFGRAL
jgi:GT2 family glycosyltransferase